MKEPTQLTALKEADALIHTEAERLLNESHVWHFIAYGWQNAYDADPEFIGHAMWQVEPAIDFGFARKLTLTPASPDLWIRQLAISGADFEGLMRAARNSIGLLFFQISLRPTSFMPDDELFDLYKMSSLLFLSTATARLRDFFILAAYRETPNQYKLRKRSQLGKTWRERYVTPFVEAQADFKNSSPNLLDPLNSLVELTKEIHNIRKRRNKLIHEIASDIGLREKRMIEDATTGDEPEAPTWEELQAAIIKTNETGDQKTVAMKEQFVSWYALLMKAINDAFIFEHHRRVE